MYHYSFDLLNQMLLEFRVPLPYCVNDPNVGYLYMCMQANLAATGGGEGVDWIKNEPLELLLFVYMLVMTIQMVI